LLKSLDYLIEFTGKIFFSDSFAFENAVDLVPDSSPEQTLQRCGKASVQDFMEHEERGAAHISEPLDRVDP